MKKRWLALLWLLYALIAPGCAPNLTYDELHDAARTAPTPELKAKYEERIERFERDAERANAYFENRAACARTSETVWYCNNPIIQDERVDLYRRLRSECGCVKRDDLLRNLF